MNSLYKLTVATLLCLLGALQISASVAVRKDSIHVHGVVKDLFSGDELNKGRYTVYDEKDSIVYSDTLMQPKDAYWGTWKYQTPGGFSFKLPRGGNYRVRFDIDDYFPDMQAMNIPDKTFQKPTVDWEQNYKLRKIPQEKMIDGVVVRATRIKMVIKGDTVEYNADAFNLAEGSMLDKLIEAMPGMELRSNGEIYNNGRKVESLLVNGKDFFNGDPKMALDNLPAYTVKSVQVYRKDADEAYLISDSLARDAKKRLVVDVKLKKEYSKGWMVNTDLAYGTSERYFAKGFGMYYTDALKLALYGNVNNLGDQSVLQSDGQWDTNTLPSGLHSAKAGGYALSYEHTGDGPNDRFQINSTGSLRHTSDDNVNKISSSTYLTGGDTHSRSHSVNRSSSTELNSRTSLSMTKRRYFAMFHPLNVIYSRRRGSTTSRSATFNAEPHEAYRVASLDSVFMPMGSQRLESMLLNTVLDRSQSISKSLTTESSFFTTFHSPIFGNNVSIDLRFYHSKNDYENFQHYLLDNRQTKQQDFQNVYQLRPGRNYNYSGRLNYDITPAKNVNISLVYSYEQRYESNNSSRYRLDSLKGWGLGDDPILGALPSNRDSMLLAMDTKNSFFTSTLNRINVLTASVRFPIAKHWAFSTQLPLNIENHKIDDQRDFAIPHDAKRHQIKSANGVLLNANADLTYWKDNNGVITLVGFNYFHNESMPGLNSLLDTRDDSNPLFITLGNPDLKNQRNNGANARFWHSNAKHMQNYGVALNWSVNENRIASAMTYDRATGVTTYQPRNINGNWNASVDANFDRFVDSKDHLRLRLRLYSYYNHSVDYITDYSGSMPAPIRSTVHNYNTRQEVDLAWTYKTYRIQFNESVRWNRQLSHRDNFSSVSAFDINYGLRSNGPIVWGVEYDASIGMMSRRGYNSSSMNTDDLICDFSLSKSMLKGKPLTIRLEVHDAFAQLKNTRNVINSQGRTETWYNAIPRYAMLHAIYKFNTMNKKKQKAAAEN